MMTRPRTTISVVRPPPTSDAIVVPAPVANRGAEGACSKSPSPEDLSACCGHTGAAFRTGGTGAISFGCSAQAESLGVDEAPDVAVPNQAGSDGVPRPTGMKHVPCAGSNNSEMLTVGAYELHPITLDCVGKGRTILLY